ncbi:MAG: cellulase family glycosylhydrolase, partial [Bdellovibrionales bacterium]|nr:cellulase family glycosylhydrolase [Bdellovibrionales bacterium]
FYGEAETTCRMPVELNQCKEKVEVNYRNGNDGLTLAKSVWNANTIRFNLNQVLLDPKGKWFDESYVKEIQRAVALARGRGFKVIAAIFDGPNQNGPPFFRDRAPPRPIDTDVSLRAIQTLTNLFGNDEGVFLEFLNEPYLPQKDNLENSFKIWINGGTSPSVAWEGAKFVGVNAMIDAVRKLGGKNAIIIQGMRGRLDEIPIAQVKDPLNKLIFAAHPFMNELNWHKTLGLMAKERPVAITAWGFSTQDLWCHQYQGVSKAFEAVDYFQKRNLGVIMFGMDAKYSAIRDFESTEPARPTEIDFLSSNCSDKDKIGRSGSLIQALFRDRFQLTEAENRAPSIKPVSDINITVGKPVKFKVIIDDLDIDPVSLRIWWNDGTVDPSPEGLLDTKHNMEPREVKILVKGKDEPEIDQNFPVFTERSTYLAEHTYKKSGKYEARVVAFDSKGSKAEQIIRINVSSR